MRIEVTGPICTGRCEIQTEWCRARACGVVSAVLTADGARIRVCGACLEEMADTGVWSIPGSRPTPWPIRGARSRGDTYTPRPDAIKVEPGNGINRGRCQVQTEVCEAREWGLIADATLPDCRDIWLCGACLERMAVTGAWDLGRMAGAAVAEMKRLAQFEVPAPLA